MMVADEKLDREAVIELVRNIDNLPALPAVVEKIIRLCNDPLTSAGDLEKVFQSDLALTGKLLKLVNSSYFALPHKVTSVTRSIAFLGFNAVKSLAMSISLPALFPDDENGNMLSYGNLWKHSLATAECARLLARESGNNQAAEDAYVSGLLHDIGKLIFQQFFHEEYNRCLKMEMDGMDLVRAEKEVFGVDHAALGGYLIETWNFMQDVVVTTRFHHPDGVVDEDKNAVSLLVNAADYYAHRFEIGTSGRTVAPEMDKTAASLYTIPDSRMENFRKEVIERVSLASLFIGGATRR